MAQRETLSVGAGDPSARGGQLDRSRDSSRLDPEQGCRLMRAFLSIQQDGLREAIVKFVTELAALEDQEP
jgi:hypothetical protein